MIQSQVSGIDVSVMSFVKAGLMAVFERFDKNDKCSQQWQTDCLVFSVRLRVKTRRIKMFKMCLVILNTKMIYGAVPDLYSYKVYLQ